MSSRIPGYDTALASASLQLESTTGIRMPWESNRLLASIFGASEEQSSLKRPRLNLASSSDDREIAVPAISSSTSSSREVRKVLPRIRPNTTHLSVTEPETERQRSLDAWLQILKIDLGQSTVGRQIKRILDTVESAAEQNIEVNSTLNLSERGKSSSTLHQRALAISQYLTWAAKEAPPAFPIDEESLFTYLRTDLQKSKGATNGTRLLESLCFAHGVWGLDGSLEAATSRRVKGQALDLHLTKEPRVPAEELSDLQLYALEACLSDKCSSTDEKLSSGALLWMIYCRNRASDTYRLKTVGIDRSERNNDLGFIEATCQGAKNAKSLSLKLELMPVVGSISGVGIASFGNWYDHYAEARRKAGLSNLVKACESKIVLLPKRTTDGILASEVAATPDDLSIALRAILAKYGWDHADTAKKSSHSCKATLLSMAAKRGTLDECERKILGYHLERGSATVKTYSRDVMSAPLRKLNSLVTEVAVGCFLPSSSRSGRFPTDENGPQIPIADRFANHLKTVFADLPEKALPMPALVGIESDDEDSDHEDVRSLSSFQPSEEEVSAAVNESCGDELGLADGSQLNIEALQTQGNAVSDEDEDSSSSSSSTSSAEAFEKLASACSVESHPPAPDLWKVKGGN
jgi:hypothetical protein